MIILVDGYNVLRGVLEGREASVQARNQFLAQLARYARGKKHTIIVVFDGGSSHMPERTEQHGISVVFSGYIDSADDLIKKKLTALHGKDVLLVSSDRELNSWASKYDIPSIEAIDFYELLQSALVAQPEQASHEEIGEIHISDGAEADLDTLMEEATRVVPIKQQDLIGKAQMRTSPSYKQSKINRKLLEILKKL
jgi:predicted RNA-binding protein with PIN domain